MNRKKEIELKMIANYNYIEQDYFNFYVYGALLQNSIKRRGPRGYQYHINNDNYVYLRNDQEILEASYLLATTIRKNKREAKEAGIPEVIAIEEAFIL